MRVFYSLATLALVSCTNLPNSIPKPAEPVSNGLAAQELAVGECGIFLWTLSKPPIFTYFHKSGSGQAKVFLAGAEMILQVPEEKQVITDFGKFVYENETGAAQHIRVKGQYGEAIDGGRRIPSGSIQFINQDGWREITPVSGIYVCR